MSRPSTGLELSTFRLLLLVLTAVCNLTPVRVEVFYAATSYGHGTPAKDAATGREEEPMNDDIIISRVTRDCPDESDGTLDCSDSMHHNKESLIYPVAQFSPRRTQVPRSSTSKSSVVTASSRGHDCDPEDENCEGSAEEEGEEDEEEEEEDGGGDDDDDDDDDERGDDDNDDEKNHNLNMGYNPLEPGRQDQSKNKTPGAKNQHGASSKNPTAQASSSSSSQHQQQRHQVHKPPSGSSSPHQTGEWTNRRASPHPQGQGVSPMPPASNGQQTHLKNGQDVSSASVKDRHFQQLAINMNIVLIAGIAAGIVVLLFILVVAACKFYASSTAPTGSKALADYHHHHQQQQQLQQQQQQLRAASKAAYAYEACNTGAKCSSPLLVPSSQQSLPVLGSASQAGLAGSATSTVSKPAKKDVKEWYV